MLNPEQDTYGVLPLLLMVSGYAAMERGSEVIDAIDLMKAIYIVDLEHVSKFWYDWEDFERLVSNQRLAKHHLRIYINRMHYLIYVEQIRASSLPNKINILGRPSTKFQEIVNAARELASQREGIVTSPTSQDLLFCIYSLDPELQTALYKSKLLHEKLHTAVKKQLP